ALEPVGDVLELLEALDVGLEDLAARPRPRGRKGVGAVDQDRLERAWLVVAVMALHGVDDLVRLPQLAQHLPPQLEVRSLHLAVDRLADVVEQARALGDLGVGTELRGHVGREPGDLLGVLEHVLSVGRPVLQTPEQLDELGMEIRDRKLARGRFPFLADALPELRADLLDDLLDARRVDAAVDDELLESLARDLPAQRLEGADDDRLGRVVDDQVDARRRLERPDVATLAADDAALQGVGRKLHDRHRRLADRVGGQALDRHPDVIAGLLRGLLGRLLLDAADESGGLDARLVLDRADQVAPRLDGGQARDLLEALLLLLDDLLDLALGRLEAPLLIRDPLLLAVVLLFPALLLRELAVEGLLLGDNPLLARDGRLPSRLHRLLELGPRGEDLLLGLDRGLAQLGLGGLLGFRTDAVRFRPDAGALGFDFLPEYGVRDSSDHGGHHEADRDRDREVCIHPGSPLPGAPNLGRRLHEGAEVLLPPRVQGFTNRDIHRPLVSLRVPGSGPGADVRAFR